MPVSMVKLGMLCHLLALIPRQRPLQMPRELLDGVGQRVADGFCVVPVRQWEEHHVAALERGCRGARHRR